MFLSPGHWWAGPPVADTAHGAGVHGAEAGSSHQTVPPDRESKSCFLCTICQLTALLHSFLSPSFPVFFYHFSLFKGFSSPISFLFSENKWNWKHWELIPRGKKNKHKKKWATNGTNFSVLVKHMERLLASLLVSLSNPLPSGARPAWIRWFVPKPNPAVADTFPRRRVRRFQVVVVCLGQFLDMNISFRQLWYSSFILKCKSSFVALPGV